MDTVAVIYSTHWPIPLTDEAADVLRRSNPDYVWPVDDDLLVWLIAESCNRKAQADFLEVVEFTDKGEVARHDLPAGTEEQIAAMGINPADLSWRLFEAVAQRPALITWLAAEATFKAGQAAIAQGEAI